MIISGSYVEMASRRTYQEQSTFEQRLQAWADPEPDLVLSKQKPLSAIQDQVELSTQALESSQANAVGDDECMLRLSPEDELKMAMLQMFLEKLTGKRFRFRVLQDIKLRQNSEINSTERSNPQQNNARRVGWGIRYNAHFYYHEAEKTSFQARGVVKTADGQEISISLQMSMSRDFTARSEVHIRSEDAIAVDPLVINYQGNAAALTQRSLSI